jgi:hypothetical protein
VLGGMSIRRVVAAPDVPADHAHPQVHPLAPMARQSSQPLALGDTS